jgi:hypothetical protein
VAPLFCILSNYIFSARLRRNFRQSIITFLQYFDFYLLEGYYSFIISELLAIKTLRSLTGFPEYEAAFELLE